MTPLVSIIIPVYNDPARIQKTLAALVRQTLPRESYEIIVADNGSIDDTPSVVQAFSERHGGRIRIVEEKTIQGSYAARNAGVRVARGELLAFTDSDCIPQPGWIASGVAALKRHNASCGGGRIAFFFKSERPNPFEHFDSGRKLNQEAFVEEAGFAATANFFALHRLIDQYGFFRDDLVSGGDYEFGRRLTLAGERMIYIPEALVMHPARATFGEIIKKSLRVAKGQKALHRLGLLKHGKSTWRNLIPTFSHPFAPGWKGRLSPLERASIIGLTNAMRWMNYMTRLG